MAAFPAVPFSIEIEMTPSEGWLLRAIGLVERRGFEILSVSAETAAPGRPARLSLSAVARDGGRSLEVLQAQIRRLHGVLTVRAVEASPRLEAAS
jgi:acetolactate synthase-1/3 small subunit/acetolactate synthase II small subunit